MDTTTRIRPNTRGITGWVLVVAGTILGATGPALSGATLGGLILLTAGGMVLTQVLHR